MDYIVPASCTDVEFRQMWAEFEWENKVCGCSPCAWAWMWAEFEWEDGVNVPWRLRDCFSVVSRLAGRKFVCVFA